MCPEYRTVVKRGRGGPRSPVRVVKSESGCVESVELSAKEARGGPRSPVRVVNYETGCVEMCPEYRTVVKRGGGDHDLL